MADAVSLDDRRVLGRTPVLKQCLKSPRDADLSLLAETNTEKAEALKDLGLRSDNLVEERRHIESAERVRNESLHTSSEQLTTFDRSPMSERESIHSESRHEPTTNWLNDLNWLNDFFVESEFSSEEALNSYDEIPGWSYAGADMKTDTGVEPYETVEKYCASLSSDFPFLARHLPDSFEPTLALTIDLCVKALQDLEESDDNRDTAAFLICELSDRFEISPEVMDRMASIRVACSSFHNPCDVVSRLWEMYDRFTYDITTEDITQTINSMLSEIATDCLEKDDPEAIRPGGECFTELFGSFWSCKDPQKKRALFTPPMLECALRFVRHEHWAHTRAGLIVLGVVAQGCTVEVASTIADVATSSLKHPKFAVRFEATYVLKSLLLAPRSIVATTHIDNVFCGLLRGLAEENYHVWSGSADVVGFVFGEGGEGVEKREEFWTEIHPHLNIDYMLTTIGEILERATKRIFGGFFVMVKFAFAAAMRNKEKIPDHYYKLIDALKPIFFVDGGACQCANHDNRWWNALRCVARVGKTARNDSQILTIIPALVESLTREDYWDYDYEMVVLALNEVWQRLSDDPFLPIILENPLFALNAKHRICDGDVDFDDPNTGPYWSASDNKQMACEMLVMIVASFGETILPYTHEISEAAMKYCKETTDIVDIRSAAKMFPLLIKSVQSQGVAAMRILWNDYYVWMERSIRAEAMTKRFDGEIIESWNNAKTRSIAITALRECIEELGKAGVSEQEIKQIRRMIVEQIEKEKNNMAKTELPRRMEKDKKFFLGTMVNLVHNCLETFGSSFYESISNSLPLIVWMTGESDGMDGILVAGELIKIDPKSTFAYEPDITQLLQLSFSSSDELIRSMAAWTAGVMAASLHEGWMSVGAQSLYQLSSMIGREGARATEDDIWATDHAIAAVSKILKFCGPEMIGLQRYNETLGLFPTWLPDFIDEEEAVHTYGFLAELVEARNAIVMGEDGTNTGLIVRIMYKGITSGVLDGTTEGQQVKNRLCDIISDLTTIRR